MSVQWGRRGLLGVTVALLVAGLGVPGRAEAADPKVRFFVDVVYGSSQGNEVDPPHLEKMKKKFAKDFTLTSFKQLSTQTVEVDAKTPANLTLPNGTAARFQLAKIDKDIAHVDMTVGKVTSRIELGKKSSVYAMAGTHQEGVLIVVVSPITDSKKRRDEK